MNTLSRKGNFFRFVTKHAQGTGRFSICVEDLDEDGSIKKKRKTKREKRRIRNAYRKQREQTFEEEESDSDEESIRPSYRLSAAGIRR